MQISNLLVEHLPRIIRPPASVMPFSFERRILSLLLKPLLAGPIEDGGLDFLHRKWLKIEVTDLNKHWYFSFDRQQLQMSERGEQADICFSGDMHSFILLGAKKVDPDALFFKRKLLITGDTELGLELKNLIDGLELGKLPSGFSWGLVNYAELVKPSVMKCP